MDDRQRTLLAQLLMPEHQILVAKPLQHRMVVIARMGAEEGPAGERQPAQRKLGLLQQQQLAAPRDKRLQQRLQSAIQILGLAADNEQMISCKPGQSRTVYLSAARNKPADVFVILIRSPIHGLTLYVHGLVQQACGHDPVF
ncbi:hypothetical protein D3C81_1728360 [compost metagenome]